MKGAQGLGGFTVVFFRGTGLRQANAPLPGEIPGQQSLLLLLLLGGEGTSRAGQVFIHSGPSFLRGDHSQLGSPWSAVQGWASLSFLRSPLGTSVLPTPGPI